MLPTFSFGAAVFAKTKRVGSIDRCFDGFGQMGRPQLTTCHTVGSVVVLEVMMLLRTELPHLVSDLRQPAPSFGRTHS
ncbi:hypothetical protein PC116_g11634 [Phytophthora cactorum]|uniref:Uncharacterized protein n=1 Tax=Phytophthora cactorum TaxID=29920 RepID=A0A8T1E0B5_9STRA|nr:hypothetical protein Pcac1_g1893 [Phytophthora cactorum]KAG2912142.1 hypothetical protein PC114_g9042 [Phytophthora cactorum]KAG2945001.1 hypothetical protein PC117_g8813 [Phytophthora cactorum]KAG3022788.1 hypothetical protein PC120_g7919 [Phytophthora cactorum]KAG3024070.1 hypothetical protein PC119_g8661 [Phytophthora cactorum]